LALNVLSLLNLLGCIVGGLLLINAKGSTFNGQPFSPEHPYAGTGVTLLVGGVIGSLLLSFLAQWAKTYAAATRNSELHRS